MKAPINPITPGERRGRLICLERIKEFRKPAMWRCICDCGAVILSRESTLIHHDKKSCGCLRVEKLRKMSRSHGGSHLPEYKIWQGMKDRCQNPNNAHFNLYGGRGIVVCERWKNSFENFLADMGPRPSGKTSIDRIDSDGNYEPSNCRWATDEEQASNRRYCHRITFGGETLNIAEWSQRTGISKRVLARRFKRGWSAADILTQPLVANTESGRRSGLLKRSPAGGAKLTAELVKAMRTQVKNGEATIVGLARTHGVSRTTIRDAVNGKSWKDI